MQSFPVNMSKRITSLSLLFLLLVTGCHFSDIYNDMEKMENDKWHMAHPAVFRFNTADSMVPLDFYLQLRNNNQYPYNNLYLFLTTEFPDGRHYTDTIECLLAQPDGNWYGKRIGSIYENSFLIKKNVVLPRAGLYTFTLKQAMRHEELEGISAVGLRIGRAKTSQ